ncbi:MAG: hypothetical protein AB1762_05775 [Gemmatimonadota bacterium]
MHRSPRAVATLLATFLLACGDATGSGGGNFAVRFGMENTAAARGNAIDARAALAVVDEISVNGTNGTLTIQDIQMVVSEVTLKRAENSACVREDRGGGDDDECKKFEGGPFLVDVPLGGETVTVLEADVPNGTFRSVEFEVEDFDMDDDDGDREHRRADEIFAALRVLYPDLPRGANMVVKGTFTPTGGAAKPFIVYFNADIEIKQRFEEPLVVEDGGGITVRIDPAKWFMAGGRVRDLSLLDGRLVEFEIEMKQGFVKIDCDR